VEPVTGCSRPGDNPLYHPVNVSACGYHPGMPDDQETAQGGELELVPRAAVRPGPAAAVAADLLARSRAELPVLAGLSERDELLAAAWLASLRSSRTRRAYAGDLRGWLAWLDGRGADVLGAGRVHVDLWVAAQKDQGAESSTVRRRLSALSSFYRYCAAHGLVDRIPVDGVTRPVVDPDYTDTVGLSREAAVEVLSPSLAALGHGQFELAVASVSRGAGTRTGRFTGILDPSGRRQMARAFADLPASDPATIPAQLSFPPLDPGTAHVTRTPALLPATIPWPHENRTGAA
jgi:Lantibiotic dehydratase, N terminus/Phage integrase, N-terminal SAM-like domain